MGLTLSKQRMRDFGQWCTDTTSHSNGSIMSQICSDNFFVVNHPSTDQTPVDDVPKEGLKEDESNFEENGFTSSSKSSGTHEGLMKLPGVLKSTPPSNHHGHGQGPARGHGHQCYYTTTDTSDEDEVSERAFGVIERRFLNNVGSNFTNHMILRARPFRPIETLIGDRDLNQQEFLPWTTIEYRSNPGTGRETFKVREGNFSRIYPGKAEKYILELVEPNSALFLSSLPDILNNSEGTFWWNGLGMNLYGNPQNRIPVSKIFLGPPNGMEFSINGLTQVMTLMMPREENFELKAVDGISHPEKIFGFHGKEVKGLNVGNLTEDVIMINFPTYNPQGNR